MRQISSLLAFVFAFTLGTALPALAATGSIPTEPIKTPLERLQGVGTSAGYGSDVTQSTLPATIGAIISALLALLGVIFMGYIIYAGFKWMIARGNEEEVEKAKSTIRQATIGLIIVLSAYAITAFVTSRLTDATGFQG